MKFWDREKEKEDLKRHLQSEPNAILFVYGPKSSGKSTLLMESIKDLSRRKLFRKKYEIHWYDLRGKLVASYRDVIDALFEAEDTEAGRFVSSVESEMGLSIPMVMGFKVKKSLREEFYNKVSDPFGYMEAVMRRSGKRQIIVFDELQKLKGIYMNGQREFVVELFNFFVRITKVMHLAHVFVMTSDTFFIEEIYTSSALKNTSEFYLVDYFDDKTALKILIDEGLSEEDARYVVEQIGGVPWMMERVLSNDNAREKVEELYLQHRARLEDVLAESYESGEYESVIETLKKVLSGNIDIIKDRKMVRKLAEREVLFFDPINRVVKFQTRLDERAAKELIS